MFNFQRAQDAVWRLYTVKEFSMKKTGNLSHMTTEEAEKFIQVAWGRKPANLAVVNCNLLNVYTGEFINDCTVCIHDRWIAYVGNDPEDIIGQDTEIIDAGGQTVIPGLIDGHTHLSMVLSHPAEFLKYSMRGGTTTIITEIMEAFPITREHGVIDFLDSLKDQPIKIYATAPVMLSTSSVARGISTETIKILMERDDIIGLGESYWQGVLQDLGPVLPIFRETLAAGKSLEGHSAGATGKNLNAYIASGISSCHEPTTAGEVLERLRMGIYVMLREGSIRRDLEAISAIKNTGISMRRLILTSDGLGPDDLMEKGHTEYVVQKAINCGFDPVTAVQMATLNVAEHFFLDGLIGGIAPGRYADLMIIPDPETIKAQYVISSGRIIVQDGELLASPRVHAFSDKNLHTILMEAKMEASDFQIKAKKHQSNVNIRIIDQVTGLVTRALTVQMPVKDGELRSDTDRDIIKVAAIDRMITPGKTFTGFIRGFCMKSGAIAGSNSWDTTDIIVAGANDADMATAVNRVCELQGGVVVCDQGNILAELPMPVMGILSDLTLEEVSQRLGAIKKAVSSLGNPFDDPVLTLITLSGAAIPFIRICEEGLVDIKTGKSLELIME